MADHNEWPRDLISNPKGGQRREFKCKDDVPPGWWTIAGENGDEGYEVNPAPAPAPEKPAKAKAADPKPE